MDWFPWAVVLSPWLPTMWLIVQDAGGTPVNVPQGGHGSKRRRRWPVFVGIIAVTLFAIVFYHRQTFAEHDHLLFFVQTFAGNWDTVPPKELDPGLYVLSAALALALNLGAIVALLSILRTVVSIKRKETMNVVTLLSVRDSLVKDHLFDLLQRRFPDLQPNDWNDDIRGAFDSATKTWADKALPELVGKSLTHEVLSLLNREVSPS